MPREWDGAERGTVVLLQYLLLGLCQVAPGPFTALQAIELSVRVEPSGPTIAEACNPSDLIVGNPVSGDDMQPWRGPLAAKVVCTTCKMPCTGQGAVSKPS